MSTTTTMNTITTTTTFTSPEPLTLAGWHSAPANPQTQTRVADTDCCELTLLRAAAHGAALQGLCGGERTQGEHGKGF